MDTNKILQTDYLDLLFAGRNKAYGGYELRRNYHKRVGSALMALAAISISVTAYGFILNRPVKSFARPEPKIVTHPIIPPPPITPEILPPPPPTTPPPAKPTIKLTPPVITRDGEVKELPPEMKDFKDALTGAKTEAGKAGGVDGPFPTGPTTGNGTGVVEVPVPEKTPFVIVDQMPSFNGDVQEWLANNVNYPDAPREAGIEGRVVIKFVVSEDGSVTDAFVEKGVNAALDAEALRAVKKMPKWNPGKQNGEAVKVYYRVPVKFALE